MCYLNITEQCSLHAKKSLTARSSFDHLQERIRQLMQNLVQYIFKDTFDKI